MILKKEMSENPKNAEDTRAPSPASIPPIVEEDSPKQKQLSASVNDDDESPPKQHGQGARGQWLPSMVSNLIEAEDEERAAPLTKDNRLNSEGAIKSFTHPSRDPHFNQRQFQNLKTPWASAGSASQTEKLKPPFQRMEKNSSYDKGGLSAIPTLASDFSSSFSNSYFPKTTEKVPEVNFMGRNAYPSSSPGDPYTSQLLSQMQMGPPLSASNKGALDDPYNFLQGAMGYSHTEPKVISSQNRNPLQGKGLGNYHHFGGMKSSDNIRDVLEQLAEGDSDDDDDDEDDSDDDESEEDEDGDEEDEEDGEELLMSARKLSVLKTLEAQMNALVEQQNQKERVLLETHLKTVLDGKLTGRKNPYPTPALPDRSATPIHEVRPMNESNAANLKLATPMSFRGGQLLPAPVNAGVYDFTPPSQSSHSRSKGRKRKHPEWHQKQRNRELAKSTREKRKLRFEGLKAEVADYLMKKRLLNEGKFHDLPREYLDEMFLKKYVVQKFMMLKSDCVVERSQWSEVLDESFTLILPAAPFDTKTGKLIKGKRRLKGIDEVVSVGKGLAAFVTTLNARARKIKQLPMECFSSVDSVKLTFFADTANIHCNGEKCMGTWSLCTENLVPLGFSSEAMVEGLLSCRFTGQKKLCYMELIMDVMGFCTQLLSRGLLMPSQIEMINPQRFIVPHQLAAGQKGTFILSKDGSGAIGPMNMPSVSSSSSSMVLPGMTGSGGQEYMGIPQVNPLMNSFLNAGGMSQMANNPMMNPFLAAGGMMNPFTAGLFNPLLSMMGQMPQMQQMAAAKKTLRKKKKQPALLQALPSEDDSPPPSPESSSQDSPSRSRKMHTFQLSSNVQNTGTGALQLSQPNMQMPFPSGMYGGQWLGNQNQSK